MTHSAILILGSNINPEENIKRAFRELASRFTIEKTSNVIESIAEGGLGPNFLNAAVKIRTNLSLEELKFNQLRCIEDELGRIRTMDKNAPRTIDIDILIFDDQVIDPNIWQRIYLAIPLMEIEPQMVNRETGEDLSEIVKQLEERSDWKARPDIKIT